MYFYGAGLGAEIAYSFLQNTEEKEFLEGIIDSKKSGIWKKYTIISIEEITDLDSYIIITARNPWGIDEINRKLREIGFHNIYSFNWCKGHDGSSSFLRDSCNDSSEWGECVLPHLEMHIADSCNLNCRGCAHFSPVFKQGFPVYEECMKDIKAVKEKFTHILRFYILGGEPLLNPELERYLFGIRRELPNTDLWLVTNGLLIPNLSEQVLTAISQNKIVISISEYQPTHRIIGKILDRLKRFNVEYDLRPYDKKQKFNKPLSIRSNSIYENNCISNGCINIWNGKISRCPTLMYIEKFNEEFGTALPNEGILELENSPYGQALLNHLKREVPLCKHCVKNEIEWHTCASKVQLEDFAVLE